MSSISEIVKDWGGFEEFAAQFLKNSSNVIIERNVKRLASLLPSLVDLLPIIVSSTGAVQMPRRILDSLRK